MTWINAIPVTLAFFTLAPAMQANIITNGTFATSADNWTLSGSAICPASFAGGTGNPAGSLLLNGCGEITANPAGAQTLSGLTPGATYTVDADVRLHVNAGGSGTGSSFGIFLDSQLVSPFFSTEFLNAIWNPVHTSFVATSASHTIIFAAELDTRTPGQPANTDLSYFVDNISAEKVGSEAVVPEPAMFWLLGSGLVATGIGRLLQRRRL